MGCPGINCRSPRTRRSRNDADRPAPRGRALRGPSDMAQATPAATAQDAGAVRIVLFGMPDAGKSSLLGALAQAAQTQEHLLNGHLTDLSQGLAELQRRLYD